MERKTQAAPESFRPYWPEALVVLSLAVCGLAPWHPQAIFWGGLPLAFALFCVTSLRPARTAGIALAAALAMALSTGLPRFEHAGAVVPFALLFAVAWAVGFAVGQRRRYLHALVRQERDRADREAAAERLRIARELHDSIAHSMSVISVQAGFGRLVLEDRPQDARSALEAIETTGRQTLVELRRMLGVLHDDTHDAGDTGLAPALKLADLNRLTERTRRPGLRIDLTVTGQARPLPPGLEAAAYRIVQEALTNVVKHADASTAHVTVAYGPDELTLTVINDGSIRPASGRTGRGLPGMRERLALYGGTLQAGPAATGGFRVRAGIPVDRPQPTAPVRERP
ncbi:MAG: sensor histidine kinase [Streptomyces sp.]|uniref:sensor histidine kinase n=1 Tax=Streptomyces sp. TaxID=1931 RepID=UPI0025D01484|nr:sensor histidine kinase [Streptomyces sp.]MBW8799043.1 sensor histidine kinase [Streptomyces sp.]